MSSGKRAYSIEAAAVRDQLVRIRASDILSGAERLRRFLSFVVEETLEGRSAQIKEYVVGVEVYGRPGTYDPRTDSIVRVEASKLRTRLQQYYDTVGRNDRIIITIPKGGYVPAFENRQTAQRPVGSFLPHPWRLTIAGGVIGLALRRWRRQAEAGDFGLPTAATTRWRVSVLPSTPLPVPGIGRARWGLELIRCRGGGAATFELEACDAKGRLALASTQAYRSTQAARART